MNENKKSIPIYDTEMICTYKMFEKEDKELANICYQMQLLQAFNMKIFDDSLLQKDIGNLYVFVKDSERIKEILTIIFKNISNYDILKTFDSNNEENKFDKLFVFQILFSYEYFDIFHKCLSLYINNFKNHGENIDENFNDLYEFIKKN